MNHLIHLSTGAMAHYLHEKLPQLSENWWQSQVVNRLSFQQQRMVDERGHSALDELDFAALLRVLDQNWCELSQVTSLPQAGRIWGEELQTIYNKWIHFSDEAMAPIEVYRDADTLGRFLDMLGATPATIATVETAKAEALDRIAADREVTAGSQKAIDDESESDYGESTQGDAGKTADVFEA